ncbi:hypothetical protein [Paramagnetospirillum magneticum]|uniref:Uncharacterized protein n=1 Tax=Paramagnetospirillum magneticum (strain ATCC 700264 / AMB-1) TaxID=342108 RepID=Q2W2F5_PARM1|nr:hypothetical protein [Paramagnetospirillum magneticum]BAE51970.1 hypothetical protein amb3166 [Paramagnetospirillum magneticum AMB-1]
MMPSPHSLFVRFHRIYGGFGAIAFRVCLVITFPFSLGLIANVSRDGFWPLAIFAVLFITGWKIFVSPPQSILISAEQFPPPNGRPGILPPDRPRDEWQSHHFMIAFLFKLALVGTWISLPFWITWAIWHDPQMKEGAGFGMIFFPFAGGLIEGTLRGHTRTLKTAIASTYLAPAKDSLARPLAEALPASPKASLPWPPLVTTVLALPLTVQAGLVAKQLGSHTDSPFLVGTAVISAFVLGLWCAWTAHGRRDLVKLAGDAAFLGVTALVLIMIGAITGTMVGGALSKLFGHIGVQVGLLGGAIGGHFTVSYWMMGEWRRGPSFGSRSGSINGPGWILQAWQPDAEVLCPVSMPDGVFFTPPPKAVGPVVAAWTSMRSDVMPLSPLMRRIHVLSMTMLFAVTAWLAASGMQLPPVEQPAWGFVGAIYGAALGWVLTSFTETCRFVGRDGFACASFEGAPPMITISSALAFSEAHALYSEQIQMTSQDIGGMVTGAETYSYLWCDNQGRKLFQLDGKFHQRNPREKSRAELDRLAAWQWTAFCLDRYRLALHTGSTLYFEAGGTRIAITANTATVVIGEERHPIHEYTIDNGVLYLTVEDEAKDRAMQGARIGNFSCLLILLAERIRPSHQISG